MYLVNLFHVGVACLEAVYMLRLICLGFHPIGAPSTLDSRICLLDSDGPITFDSRSELVSTDIFMGWVVVLW
jgi:hypothetical protein